MSHAFRLSLLGYLTGAGLLAVALPTLAEVQEPKPFQIDAVGTPQQRVPIDEKYSADYFDDAHNSAILSLPALFQKEEGGKVDYQKDAALEPATFSPLCGLQGSLLLRGGSCRMDFGWYCKDDPTTFVPLVTSQEVLAFHDKLVGVFGTYKNDDKGFVPNVKTPAAEGALLSDIQSNPVFQNCPSKQIGFSIKPTNDPIPSVKAPVCIQQKWSEASRNQICSATKTPWITALVYASKTQPGVFYIAFEDMPQDANSFNPAVSLGTAAWKPDADFNDFVYKVQGIVCEGGGQLCETGKPGVCAAGVTDCTKEVGVSPECRQSIQPTAEECDNQDNDCNGMVDDGEGLCTGPNAGKKCYKGTCVGNCANGEFPCPGGEVCDNTSALCVEIACKDKVCTGGSVCRGGQCVGGCEGVVCPEAKTCVLGRCIDPCNGIKCPDSFVCNMGACVADCRCLPCPSGKTCDASGRCLDTACKDVVCEGNLVCSGGACVDACATIKCPAGNACIKGDCVPTGEPITSGSSTGEITFPSTGPGTTGGLVIPTTGSLPSLPGSAGQNAGMGKATSDGAGCGCQVIGSRNAGAGVLGLLLGLGLLVARRRR